MLPKCNACFTEIDKLFGDRIMTLFIQWLSVIIKYSINTIRWFQMFLAIFPNFWPVVVKSFQRIDPFAHKPTINDKYHFSHYDFLSKKQNPMVDPQILISFRGCSMGLFLSLYFKQSIHQIMRNMSSFLFGRKLRNITTKLCGANEAQRSLRPNERLVIRFYLQVIGE